MPITPDTKDWTWVLERACKECGFDVTRLRCAEIAVLLRQNAASWTLVLDQPTAAERRSDGVWSILEYGAHVRDGLGVFLARLERMLAQDDPELADWDQDAAAVAGDYAALDPAAVAAQLGERAEAAALALERLVEGEPQRGGLRSDGAQFTVETLARYFAHDVLHHLHDALAQVPKPL